MTGGAAEAGYVVLVGGGVADYASSNGAPEMTIARCYGQGRVGSGALSYFISPSLTDAAAIAATARVF